MGFCVQDSGFKVPGSGFRVSGFGFRVAGCGFRLSGCRLRVSGFGIQISVLGPTFGFWASFSGFGFRVSGVGFRISGFRFWVPGFRDSGFGIRLAPRGRQAGDRRPEAGCFPPEPLPLPEPEPRPSKFSQESFHRIFNWKFSQQKKIGIRDVYYKSWCKFSIILLFQMHFFEGFWLETVSTHARPAPNPPSKFRCRAIREQPSCVSRLSCRSRLGKCGA